MRNVILIGNGKLAQAIEDNFKQFSSLPVRKYHSGIEANQESFFVHIGSGRQYGESLAHAHNFLSPYIQAATEKDIKMEVPTDPNIPFLLAPNLDINIIKLFYLLGLSKNLFNKEPKSIIESHQADKKSQPGTALKFCTLLNIFPEKIISIRDPQKQTDLKISNISHHAFHKIEIGNAHSKLIFETRIEGALSYVEGLAKIIEAIPKLAAGIFTTEDLLKKDIL